MVTPIQTKSAFLLLPDSKDCLEVGQALGPTQMDLPMLEPGFCQPHLKLSCSPGPKKWGSNSSGLRPRVGVCQEADSHGLVLLARWKVVRLRLGLYCNRGSPRPPMKVTGGAPVKAALAMTPYASPSITLISGGLAGGFPSSAMGISSMGHDFSSRRLRDGQ